MRRTAHTAPAIGATGFLARQPQDRRPLARSHRPDDLGQPGDQLPDTAQ